MIALHLSLTDLAVNLPEGQRGGVGGDSEVCDGEVGLGLGVGGGGVEEGTDVQNRGKDEIGMCMTNIDY